MPQCAHWGGRGTAKSTDHERTMEKNKKLTSLAQKLRKTQTKEENLLWYLFLSQYSLRFRRQYTIGSYIVDFYCHKARLVIELDGSQHCEAFEQERDRQRTAFLEEQGLCVLRYSNLDILRRFTDVCAHIDIVVKERISTGCMPN